MALIVEDGSIVTGANSYVSTTDLTTYATARGVTLVADEEQLLIKAMDYIESLRFKGVKRTQDQALQWPRINVVIDNYTFDSDAIPQELINGQCEVAIAIDQDLDPLANIERSTKKEKVGPLEVEYSDSAASYTINRKIMNALWKLITGGSRGNILAVGKG